ncbi:MAG: hypothetical protein KME17_19710 [Cyanosarcina radialis HA8281-LM2]|jgi:hypothetical protein|nr:hypothetical protein [Cyanosarcina radialis HA8281-LM2]
METFQQFVEDFGDCSWVVLFARASIDLVSDVYSTMLGSEIERNVPVDSTPTKLSEQWSPTGVVVRVADSDWTIIFHLVGSWSMFDTENLSKNLQAKVLEFSAEDTSGVVSCELFAPGGEVTHFLTVDDSEYQEEIYEEMSEHIKELELDIETSPFPESTIVESYENLFFSLGIQTVKLSLSSSRTVIATGEERSKIIRVDLVREISTSRFPTERSVF